MALQSVGGEFSRLEAVPAPKPIPTGEPEFDRLLEGGKEPAEARPQAPAAPDYMGRASLAAILGARLTEEGEAVEAYLRELEGRFGSVVQALPTEESPENLLALLSQGSRILISENLLAGMAARSGRAGYYGSRIRRFLTAEVLSPQHRALLTSLGLELSMSALMIQADGEIRYLFAGEAGGQGRPVWSPLMGAPREDPGPLSVVDVQVAQTAMELPAALASEPSLLQTGVLLLVSFIEGLLPRARHQGRKKAQNRRVEGAKPRWLKHRSGRR